MDISFVDEYFEEQNELEKFERVLYEAYITPDLQWIDSFTDDLYELAKTLNSTVLIGTTADEVKKIALKYDVELFVDINHLNSGPASIIKGWYVKPKKYYIEVGFDFLSSFVRKNLMFYTMKNMLKQVFTHENTHEQQTIGVDDYILKKITTKRDNDIKNSPDKKVTYHSHYFEIDAFARGFANAFLGVKPDCHQELLNAIRDNKLEELVATFSKRDQYLFNKLRIYLSLKRTKPDVWKKFVQEMYDYVQADLEKEVRK
jgi:hypothetical protein